MVITHRVPRNYCAVHDAVHDEVLNGILITCGTAQRDSDSMLTDVCSN